MCDKTYNIGCQILIVFTFLMKRSLVVMFLKIILVFLTQPNLDSKSFNEYWLDSMPASAISCLIVFKSQFTGIPLKLLS